MGWFKGIEGTRAWLAWLVVAVHIVHFTGLDQRFRWCIWFATAGDEAVDVFIVISGFVITHLILTKHEPYRLYLFRRFMRIYPVYIVCLASGAATTLPYLRTMAAEPWGQQNLLTAATFDQLASLQGNGFIENLLAHLTLLHGAISSNWLYESEYMLLSPAWSLSLEWQFYLVAPLIMLALRRQATASLLVLIVFAAIAALHKGLFGTFFLPSFLPCATYQFAAGIVTRLVIPSIPRRTEVPVAASLFIVAAFHHAPAYFFIWYALVIYMIIENPSDRISVLFMRFMRSSMDSPVANWAGRRSYSVYLIHYPILEFLIHICGTNLHLRYWPTVGLVFVVTPLLVLVLSELVYRFVEEPGIAWSKRLSQRIPATQSA